MKTNSLKSALGSLLLLCAVTPVSAVVLDWNVTKPVDDVFHAHDPVTPTGNYSWYSLPAETRLIAQTFTLAAGPDDFEMSAITMRLGLDLGASFPDNAPFTLSIYSVPSATPSTPNPIGTLLRSETGTIPDATALAGSYFTFTLDSPVFLDTSNLATRAFSFVLEFGSPASNQQINVAISSPQIPGNRLVSKTGAGAWVYPSATTVFLLEGTAVPEPSAGLLVGLAALAMVTFRRRVACRKVA